MTTILIIGDERNLAKEISNFLKDYICTVVHTFNDVSYLIKEKEYNIILLDLKLPDGNCINLIHSLKKKKSASEIIALSTSDESDMLLEALDAGADDFLIKPFHLFELHARLKALIIRKAIGYSILKYKHQFQLI